MIRTREVSAIVEATRNGSLRLEIHTVEIEVSTEVFEPVPGGIAIEINNGTFVSRWTVPRTSEVPPQLLNRLDPSPAPRVETSSDRFRIRGETVEGIQLILEGVSTQPSNTRWLVGGETYHIEFETIRFIPYGVDALDSEGLRQRLSQTNSDATRGTEPAVEEIFAYIQNVDLLPRNESVVTLENHPFLGEIRSRDVNCYLAQIHGGSCCLQRAGTDLRVYFRRPLDESHEVTASAVFSGILFAVGVIHGCHPWPYYFEHRCDHRLISRWVKISEDCKRSPTTPFIPAISRRSSEVDELFRTCSEFMSHHNDDTAFFKRVMWLMREANPAGIAFEIRLVALCSLLQGMMRRLAQRLLTPEERNAGRETDSWRPIVERLDLRWEGQFERALESWNYYRNPLSHGMQSRSAERPEMAFNANNSISAAIYILMAREMGFDGSVDRFWRPTLTTTS